MELDFFIKTFQIKNSVFRPIKFFILSFYRTKLVKYLLVRHKYQLY